MKMEKFMDYSKAKIFANYVLNIKNFGIIFENIK